MILEEIDLDHFQEPERDVAKARAKRIIADSIKYHLSCVIPEDTKSVRCYDEAIKEE